MLKPGMMCLTQTGATASMVLIGTVPDWSYGNVYPSSSFTRIGGVSPFTYTISSGALPAGLSIDSGTGAITGTPTAGGNATFNVHVVDTNGLTADVSHTMNIAQDAQWSDVVLLMHGEGSNGSTTLTDSSATGRTVTAHNSFQVTTAQKAFGSASLQCRVSTTDNASTAHTTNLDLSTSTPDFTIEAWIYRISAPSTANSIIDKDGTSGSSYPSYAMGIVNSTNTLRAIVGTGNGVGAAQVLPGVTAVPATTWVHAAMARKGTKLFLFLNGKLEATATIGTMVDGGKALYIGWENGQVNTSCFDGEIDEVRVTKGYCRYDATSQSVGTQTFTAPTMPFPNG